MSLTKRRLLAGGIALGLVGGTAGMIQLGVRYPLVASWIFWVVGVGGGLAVTFRAIDSVLHLRGRNDRDL